MSKGSFPVGFLFSRETYDNLYKKVQKAKGGDRFREPHELDTPTAQALVLFRAAIQTALYQGHPDIAGFHDYELVKGVLRRRMPDGLLKAKGSLAPEEPLVIAHASIDGVARRLFADGAYMIGWVASDEKVPDAASYDAIVRGLPQGFPNNPEICGFYSLFDVLAGNAVHVVDTGHEAEVTQLGVPLDHEGFPPAVMDRLDGYRAERRIEENYRQLARDKRIRSVHQATAPSQPSP